MIALAIAPAIKPRTIHATIPISIASEKGGLTSLGVIATGVPASSNGHGCRAGANERRGGMTRGGGED
jgi:hypothetical protein